MGPGPLEVVPGFVGFVGLLVGLGVGGVVSPGEFAICFSRGCVKHYNYHYHYHSLGCLRVGKGL